MNSKTQKEVVAIFIVAFIFVVIINIHVQHVNSFLVNLNLVELMEVEFADIAENEFEQFALGINFLYEMIPQTLQIISVGGIGTVLLQRGFNMWIFGVVIAIGKLTGQFLLYGVGRIFRHRGKKWGDNATVDHWLHKYHFVVFLFPAWTGTLGDIIMLYAGHQKINPIKIAPILFISNLAEAYRWIIPQVAQLEAIDAFN